MQITAQESNGKQCYLVMIDAADNHNKYYHMVQNGNKFTALYGRVGANPQSRTYSMSVWDVKREEKLNKGYIDQTDLHLTVNSIVQSEYEEIDDNEVRQLVDALMRYANDHVKREYKVTSKEVTPQMVKEAQHSIDVLSRYADREELIRFNNELMRLFSIIPRRMSDVETNLGKDPKKLAEIVDREQKLLDVMKSLVTDDEADNVSVHTGERKGTILDALGLSIRSCNDSEVAKIKEKLTAESSGKLKKAYRIEQKQLEKRYRAYCEKNHIRGRDEHFYYHGTKNQNVWNIIQKGLLINPNAPITGKMFGYGIYFAPRAKKSINYTSLAGSYWAHGTDSTGYLLVFKVAYKNPLHVTQWTHDCSQLTKNKISKRGHDALFAHKGVSLVNDEVIVYDEAQINPRYLLVLQ